MGPRIAITPWRRPVVVGDGYTMVLYTLDPAYVEFVKRAGGVPFIVPQVGDAKAALDGADGLLLTGGDDIDPELYGAVNNGHSMNVDPATDRWELALVTEARAQRMPVLAVCRGMQLLSVACGGRLEQEVASLGLPDHPDLSSLSIEEIYALRHEVEILPHSRLASIANQSTVIVNNIHHQVVIDPGTLSVSARSKTGLIEAVEAQDDWPALGVQWHPEKLQDDLSERLFVHLVREAEAYRMRHGRRSA